MSGLFPQSSSVRTIWDFWQLWNSYSHRVYPPSDNS